MLLRGVHYLLLLVIHVSNVCDYDDGDCGREYPVNPIPFSGSYAIMAFTKAVLFQLTFRARMAGSVMSKLMLAMSKGAFKFLSLKRSQAQTKLTLTKPFGFFASIWTANEFLSAMGGTVSLTIFPTS